MSAIARLYRCQDHGLVESVHEIRQAGRLIDRCCPVGECGMNVAGPFELVALDDVRAAVAEAAGRVTDRPRLTVDLVDRRLRRPPRRRTAA